MKLEFIRNIQFSKLIKVNGRLKEFNFRKPNSKESPFTVDVIDDRANRIIFHMQKTDDKWKRRAKSPDQYADAADSYVYPLGCYHDPIIRLYTPGIFKGKCYCRRLEWKIYRPVIGSYCWSNYLHLPETNHRY